MSHTLKDMDKFELINLERLAQLLKGLSPAEIETLEILLDKDSCNVIDQSLKELENGQKVPLNDW